ncbi:hypothetical protein [Acinetobacter tianfuensis]|nr:hypothetical protein [Acinetobacter tianfuensis]
MQAYRANALVSYPACPQCSNAGQLQGTIESQDLLKHPVSVAKSLLHSTLAYMKR